MKSLRRTDVAPAGESSAILEQEVRGLMLAVLEDAIGTYMDGVASSVPAKRLEAFKVEAWAASEDCDWPFSFVNVCEAIGIDPDGVRGHMERLRRSLLGDGH